MKLIFDLSANGLRCQVCMGKSGLCKNREDIGESMECSDGETCLYEKVNISFAITDRFNNLNPK